MQDADLGDQLGPEHQDLLVVDIAGLRTLGDLLGQRLFMGQDRLSARGRYGWGLECAMVQP